MKKQAIAATIGATLVGLLIGSTLGMPSGVSAKSEVRSASVVNAKNCDIDELASILKLTAEELKSQLMSGKTLAQIAEAQNVNVSLVVNAIVAKMKAHVTEAVAAGKITQSEADTKLADMKTKITEMVNTGRPAGMSGSKDHSMTGGMGNRMNGMKNHNMGNMNGTKDHSNHSNHGTGA